MSKIAKGTITVFIISLLAGLFLDVWDSRYKAGYKDGLGIGLNNSCKEWKAAEVLYHMTNNLQEEIVWSSEK